MDAISVLVMVPLSNFRIGSLKEIWIVELIATFVSPLSGSQVIDGGTISAAVNIVLAGLITLFPVSSTVEPIAAYTT